MGIRFAVRRRRIAAKGRYYEPRGPHLTSPTGGGIAPSRRSDRFPNLSIGR